MKRYCYFLMLILCLSVSVAGQNNNLPTVLASSTNEFSGMCFHNGRLYLLPQSKNANAPNGAVLYSIDTNKLAVAPDGSVTIPDDAVMQHQLRNFAKIASRFQKYGGFEAVAMMGNNVYMTVETDSDTDAIVVGEWLQNEIVLYENTIKLLPKVRKQGLLLPNAGYENLATYGGSLVTAFEYNYKGDSTCIYVVDTGLNGKIQPISMAPIPFRLTDLTQVSANKYLGINVYWNFNGVMRHREAYYKEIDATADADLQHWKPNECFARIIEITISGSRATWKTQRLIPANDCINWEGMVTWRNGVLLISDDNKLPFLHTKLRYYPLNIKP